MATTDPVGTAVASIAAGAASGAAVMTAGVALVRHLQRGDPANLPAATGTLVIAASLFLAIVAAVAVSWRGTRTIEDLWRRGVSAAVSVFGAILLALLAAPADLLAGWVGLACYVVVLCAGALGARRAARHAAER